MVACGSVATGHCWTLKVMGSVHMYCVELGKGKGKGGIPVKLKTYQPQHQRFPHFQKVQENIYSFSLFKTCPRLTNTSPLLSHYFLTTLQEGANCLSIIEKLKTIKSQKA